MQTWRLFSSDSFPLGPRGLRILAALTPRIYIDAFHAAAILFFEPYLSPRCSTAQVIDHYEKPRNVGSFDKNDANVGTGLVGAPGTSHIFLSIVAPATIPLPSSVPNLVASPPPPSPPRGPLPPPPARPPGPGPAACGDVMKLQIKVDDDGNIVDSCFKTFGCGSAIASSSVATEWVKGKTIEDVLEIKNADIAKHLSLPPVKLHCSMLAEDAIKAAVKDIKEKRAKKAQATA